jgi:energy-coupling factor transport system ATP-binding protein
LSDIQYRYPGTGWVLKGIDLSIAHGEYVVIYGANGSGKSTLGYLLNGLIPHFFGGTLKGSVSIDDTATQESSPAELFSHVGLVFQNADAQLFNSTVENEIAFGLESLGLPGREIDKRILKTSRTLHIEDLLARSPMTLSGGEKRLVAIASVLCVNPSILLLDEPYASLDWEGVDRVREALRELHRRGKTVVVLEQKVGDFLRDTTRCLIVSQGKILFDGMPRQAHEELLRENLVPRYPRRKKRKPAGKDSVLTLRDLSYRIEKKEIIRGVSFELRRGETVAIIGKNGSGKTTLIKHFNGLLRPTAGEVMFRGETIRGKTPSAMAANVGLSFQNPNDQFFRNRVRDELLEGPKILGKEEDGWIREICDIFELHGLLDRSPFRLSEGEKRRVALSSILAMQPKLLVLDEPTAGQDGHFRGALAMLLAALEDRGFTIIIVTHDLRFAQATADRWIVLLDGRVAADGSPEDLLGDEQLMRLGALGRPDQGWRFLQSS